VLLLASGKREELELAMDEDEREKKIVALNTIKK